MACERPLRSAAGRAPDALSNRDDRGACRGPLQRLVIPPLVRAILFCHRSKTAGYTRAGSVPFLPD